MKSIQPNAGVFGCESPVDGFFSLIASLLPGSYLPLNGVHIRKAPSQAWPFENRQFDLSDIEPAAMFGCVMPFNTLGDASSLCRSTDNSISAILSQLAAGV
jgi:hypothetical protein